LSTIRCVRQPLPSRRQITDLDGKALDEETLVGSYIPMDDNGKYASTNPLPDPV
jgi:hypothetical protein